MEQQPLELTPEQVAFIRPLLDMEFKNGQPRLILAQVRRKPWSVEDQRQGIYQIAFALIAYDIAVKVLDLIDGSARTRYAPTGEPKKREKKIVKRKLPDVTL